MTGHIPPDSVPDPFATPPEPPLPRRRWARGLIVGILIAANVAIFGTLGALWLAARQVTGAVSTIPATDLSLADPPSRLSEPRTFLLIGSDSREDVPEELGNLGYYAGQRADVIMLAKVIPGEGRLMILSIPRDLKVDDGGVPSKINGALNDGAPAIVDAVTAVTGVGINHYIQIDFAGFAGMVDAIGGIEMTFPYPARDINAKLDLPAGRHTLDGAEALALARSRSYQEFRNDRWVSVDASDIGRTRRQQDLLLAMLTQIDRPSSIGGFGELLDALGGFVVIDNALDEDVIIQLAWEMRSLDADDLEAATLPVTDLQEAGIWYVIPIEPAATETLLAFDAGVAMNAPTEAITVAVQNGNGRTGAATAVAETLGEIGFEVTSVTNSGREDYARTLVLARPDDLPRAEAVVEALGYGEATVGRPPTDADVVVIVGLDAPDL